MIRCVNIDWLEVYALESRANFPCDADFFRRKGLFVSSREYGTRVYREMFTIEDAHGLPILEIRRNPYSETSRDGGLFPPESCHIRLANRTCYAADPIGILRQFLVTHDYTLVKIFRIDICLDFERFDRGDDPQKFLNRFMKGAYSKINQSRLAAHGNDQWDARRWNSLSWGKPKSMISTKFYCKTQELREVKDKPYIRQSWFLNHLIDDPISMQRRDKDGHLYTPDIWRVEFSIKSSAKRWFIIERSTGKKGNIPMPHTLDMYDTPQRLLIMFASLADHYFHFKVYEDGKRKDRCRDKVLFDFRPDFDMYKPDTLASTDPTSKPLERLKRALNNYALTHPSPDLYKAINTILDSIDETLVRQFLSSDAGHREILLLQSLIRERIGNTRAPALAEHAEQLRKLIENYPKLF